MTTSKITMMDGLPTLALTQEILNALGLEIGADVELSITERKLSVRAVSEAERAAKLNRIFAELLVERDSAYRRLAEGVK